jgi:AcrR family transcriptional regulator
MIGAMAIPIRVLRAEIEDLRGARPLMSHRELDRRDMILAAARRLIAAHGRAAVTMNHLAGAVFIASATLRRYFPDMDNLLGEILRIHLRTVSRALAGVPFGDGDRRPALRAAYIAATRTALGGPTEAHLIMLMTRQHLAWDERKSIDAQRDVIGDILAGDHGPIALNLLDMPELDAAAVERMLAASAQPQSDAGAPADIAPPAMTGPAAPPEPRNVWVTASAASAVRPRKPPRRPKSAPDAAPHWPGPSLYATAIKDLARARDGPGRVPD